MEEKQIVWSRRASIQFEAAQNYIAEEAPRFADAFIDRILELTNELLEYPKIGRVVPEYANPNVRERIHGHYRILYNLDNEEIQILALYHDAQLLPENL